MSKKNNKIIIPILVFVAFIGGAVWSYLVINQLDKGVTLSDLTNNVGKSYTISENSISGAVDKIYDATVVVSTYKNDKIVSTGTGFVYKKEGNTAYIMTNNHVISGGDSAKVIFSDGSVADTKIVGGETYSDIAVLTTSASNIKQVAIIGNTEKLNLGDTTFAVGAPLGDTYSGTVTKGIISGKDRLVAVSFSGGTSDYYMEVLQTDAALNPGNSGGPLCNINGEVIGVNSLKLTQEKSSATTTYSVEGMGFAIPIEDALYYAETIENEETIKRPYIGISMLDITDSYNLLKANITLSKDINKGVVVLEVVDDSPAKKSGLQKGDVILKLENEEIASVAKLRYELYKYKPGSKIKITYNRNGKESTTEISLEEFK